MPRRVFLSSTSHDLKNFRLAAATVAKATGWDVVMMEDFEDAPEYTVDYCRSRVHECQLVILLVAFRVGWIPAANQGGDGQRSVTGLEYDAADQRGVPVRVLMADGLWPVNQMDEDQSHVRRFRGEMNHAARFFQFESAESLTSDGSPFRGQMQDLFAAHAEWVAKKPRDLVQSLLKEFDIRAEGHESFGSLATVIGEECEGFVSKRIIESKYQAAHPASDALPRRATALESMVEAAVRLGQFPNGSAGGHPLSTFLRSVATAESPRLSGWADAWDAQQGVQPVAQAKELPNAATRVPCEEEPPAPLHRVVVWFEPAATRQDAWHLRAWLIGDGPPEPLPLEKELCTAENRARLLGQLDEGLTRRVRGKVVIELVLPRTLLGEPVDRWMLEIADDDFPIERALGDEYQVIVRMRERSRPGSRFHQPLLQRWQGRLRDAWGRPCVVRRPAEMTSDFLPVAVSTDRAARELFRWTHPRTDVACVLLDAPFPTQLKEADEVVKELLMSGVPIVVWSRQLGNSADVLAELRRLVEGFPLSHLRLRSHWHRCDSTAYPLTAEHLTVVWDCPDAPVPEPDATKYGLQAT